MPQYTSESEDWLSVSNSNDVRFGIDCFGSLLVVTVIQKMVSTIAGGQPAICYN